MNKTIILSILFSFLSITQNSFCASGSPRVFPVDTQKLEVLRGRIQSEELAFSQDIESLSKKADSILKKNTLYSVTFNAKIAPSGDINDYYSQSPYWWPNPNTENGLPYIRKDGVVNPERDLVSDRKPCEKMMEDVRILILSYTFTKNENYAEFASKLLKTWFINEDTKMNPNIRYGQAIPGVHDGTGAGIIATRRMPQIVSLIPLLQESTHWTAEDHSTVKTWFKEYTQWLLTNPTALKEKARENNHGSAYDMQVIAYSIFTEQEDIAKKILNENVRYRIETQIEADGAQPLEIDRTKSWHYCIENLKYLMSACIMGKKIGVDLFEVKGKNNAGIQEALDYLTPYVYPENEWPHKNIKKFAPERLRFSLLLAQIIYPDSGYDKIIKDLNWEHPSLIDQFCLPAE